MMMMVMVVIIILDNRESFFLQIPLIIVKKFFSIMWIGKLESINIAQLIVFLMLTYLCTLCSM